MTEETQTTTTPNAESRPDRYDPRTIEEKWAARWANDPKLYAY